MANLKKNKKRPKDRGSGQDKHLLNGVKSALGSFINSNMSHKRVKSMFDP